MRWGVAPATPGPGQWEGTEDHPKRLGKYEVLSRLAQGGMADLYIGRLQGALGFSRLVVLKRLLPRLAEDAVQVGMFLDEARLAAQIHHPNVVQIFDLEKSGDDYYIAMELIPGPSLAAIRKPVPWPVAVEIIAQACDGLHAAHELHDTSGRHLGLVHRDVSPGNLLVTANGWVKVLDFGVARVNETPAKMAPRLLIGKYAYMSPELVRGESLDRRADVFALGVVLHQLLTGKRIFLRDSPPQTFEAICSGPIPDPREEHPDVPEELVPVIHRALERDRARRFPTAEALALALRDIVETSARVVARHLERECAVVLEGKVRSIQEASQLTSIHTGTPTVEGDSGGAKAPASAALRRRRRRLALAILATFVAVFAVTWVVRALDSPPPALKLGLAPCFVHDRIRRELGAFLAHLERRLDRRLELVVDRGYDDLRLDLVRGRLDLAVLPHSQVLFARQLPRPPPVVAAMRYRGATTYRSVIVVRDNVAVRELARMAGRSFCWVSRSSASGYLVPRLHLRDLGLDPDRLFGRVHHSGSHLAAVQDLLAGRCDGAAISAGWLHLAPKYGVDTSRLRIVAITGRIPLDRVCVRPGLSAQLRRTLRESLLALEPQRHINRDVLGVHYLVDGFAPPNTADFKTIERALKSEGIIPP